ncbi:MAG: chromate resistance protein [Nitrospirae bacterium]|nr:chromate resistance protein [Nitrospirota bacterium]
MKGTSGKITTKRTGGWLLFFYSVPSRPVSNRMKIWRKLSKAGAVQLKGAVYILPMGEEHYEFFQWLVSEVSSMGGEAAFTKVAAIDSIKDDKIKALFNERQEGEYQAIAKVLDDIESKVSSIKKGSSAQDAKAISEQLTKALRIFEEARKTDFFTSKTGNVLRARIDALNTMIKGFAGTVTEAKAPVIRSRKLNEYQRKMWVTRKRPFIDRMASAWLISRFIDKKAAFDFIDDNNEDAAGGNAIVFDMRGGDFTHTGDLCTFEVLVRSFGLKDKALKKIAEIVHDLDMKDNKYNTAEAKGLEDILTGIRMTTHTDAEALKKGMTVFEMLYVSRSG